MDKCADNIDISTLLPDEFYEINLDSLRLETTLDFDIFINRDGKYILYRERSLPFTLKEKERLKENKIDRIFINAIDKKTYFNYVEDNLINIVNDPKVPEDKKSSIVYHTSIELIKDVLNDPRAGENVKRSKNVVNGTLDYVIGNEFSMRHLLRVMSFDYYTYTHSVNVSLFAIALAEKLDIKDRKSLFEFGLGALLHDIGKSKISDSILNKKGTLTDEEFEIIKKHPIYGAEILKEKGNEIPENSIYPVLQHHEKINGTGYPYGLKGDQIHIYGKIVGVSDVFDALTTKRSYKDAINSFDALSLMKEYEGYYDPYVFEKFIKLMAKEQKNR